MAEPALIGVDWGASSVRAFLISPDGGILETCRADDGIFTGHGAFDTRLRTLLRDWPRLPILMCGMIGSDRGWLQAPYVKAPAGLNDLAKWLAPVPFDRPAHILPGVSYQSGDTAEVMRGEETLLMGLGLESGRVCLPGTHSKWAEITHGRIASFRTYMTGELRALLLAQSSLAPTTAQTPSAAAFARGLTAAVRDGLTHALFQSRARRLLGTLAPEHIASFISGALIAAEIAQEPAIEPVTLAGGGPLATEYAAALTAAGISHTITDPEPLAARGLHATAQTAGLLR